ncbi:hypothetical protein JEOAER750_01587 [Jeotgalicoccus aerolatus]|uniref:Uncharacterized protein n=1 Tax=Jeotgalicoccus aerolatus TaxID=709510 RepID=A0A1G8VYI8_9STAP|nr:hypothetical protein [Jeotgalicoccus aerolatus]MBP1951353.1 hypothetical protein [Jeotgalicoccus aerolatus]NMA80851.1 hypothetical protein [Jeotgalicoccus aerolatus]CAD2077019.1 hypothetical protein JEOAER750_01587 [Jeotgalicoccus aerolatus]SDJ70823.1 hypothetical protein SAMN05216187_10262 [Jeotgalicoccus aerolatus]GGD98164.1 hypothetical protein GCM10007273_08250 [Jeotgalicoccus aerolatus]
MNTEQIMSRIQNEKLRTDKMFKGIEFNIRDERIIMNYLYDDYGSNEDTNTDMYMPHGEDPVFINEEEMKTLTAELNKENIYFNVRKDEFI